MVRGLPFTFIFNSPIKVSEIAQIKVTIKVNDVTCIARDITALSLDKNKNTITWQLTANDTSRLPIGDGNMACISVVIQDIYRKTHYSRTEQEPIYMG